MAHFRGNNSAFGAPGIEPRWTYANKDGIGTANSIDGRIWFTIGRDILTEVHYPTVDRPQLRDLEFLFSDGNGLFLEEKRDLDYEIERILPSQCYSISSRKRQNRFSFTKEIIAANTRSCGLLHTRTEGSEKVIQDLKAYVLCAPHLEVGGEGNNAFVIEVSGRELLVAEKHERWLAIGSSCNFSRLSCGYIGQSDGYTNVAKNHKMTFGLDQAKNGNVALTGELNLSKIREFTIGVAFGDTLPSRAGQVFDLIPKAAARYRDGKIRSSVEFWLPRHPIPQARRGHTLRVCAPEPFRLRWSTDQWKTWKDSDSRATGVGGEYFDLAAADFEAAVEFTFFWTRPGQWEGQNHVVRVQ